MKPNRTPPVREEDSLDDPPAPVSPGLSIASADKARPRRRPVGKCVSDGDFDGAIMNHGPFVKATFNQTSVFVSFFLPAGALFFVKMPLLQ